MSLKAAKKEEDLTQEAQAQSHEPGLRAFSHFLNTAPAILLPLGDFRGPVIGAVGTPYFEPDGVVF
jgi:hypothetical protein